MKGTTGATPRASSSILTLPNAISLLRIVAIPPLVWLIVRPATTTIGLVTLAVVLATDWVDGAIARRTGQVSELGRILDPLADRLVLAAGLLALMARGLIPPWAALTIVVRDAIVVAVGGLALLRRGLRVDVRFLGKSATFSLMLGVVLVSWGELDLPVHDVALALGWVTLVVGLLESYGAAVVYVVDLRRAL